MVLIPRLIAAAVLVFALSAGTSCDRRPSTEEMVRRTHKIRELLRAGGNQYTMSGMALGHYKEALALVDKELDPKLWAEVAFQVARTQVNLSAWKEAEELGDEILRIRETEFGPKAPETAAALHQLAAPLQATNRLTAAEALMRRALAIYEAEYPSDRDHVTTSLNSLAAVLMSMDREAEAIPLIRRALDKHNPNASFAFEYAKVTARVGDKAGMLERSLRLMKTAPDLRPTVITLLRYYVVNLLLQQSNEEEEPYLRALISIIEYPPDGNDGDIASALHDVAERLEARNRLAEAEPLRRWLLGHEVAALRPSISVGPSLEHEVKNYRALLKRMGDTEAQAEEKIAKILEPIGKK